MLTGARSIVTVLLAGVAVAGPLNADAAEETQAEACHASLSGLEDARASLDQLRAAVREAKRDLAALETRAAELAYEVAQASGRQRAELEAQRRSVAEEISTIAELLPTIQAQANALAIEVEQAEREYIRCIEATL